MGTEGGRIKYMKKIIIPLVIVLVASVGGYFAILNKEKPISPPDSELLNYEDIEREMCRVAPEEGVVFRSQEELDTLRRGICKDAPLEIDFAKNSILGMKAETGGCGADFDKKILRDNIAKEIRYSIKVAPYGNCLMIVKKNNWVLIDKIPSDFKVIFEPITYSPGDK